MSMSAPTPEVQTTKSTRYTGRRVSWLIVGFALVLVAGWYLSYNWKYALNTIGDSWLPIIGLLLIVVLLAVATHGYRHDSRRSTLFGYVAVGLLVVVIIAAVLLAIANQINLWGALIVGGTVVALYFLVTAITYVGPYKNVLGLIPAIAKGAAKGWRDHNSESIQRAASVHQAATEAAERDAVGTTRLASVQDTGETEAAASSGA